MRETEQIVWLAIRLNEHGREWMDTTTIGSEERATKLAKAADTQVPGWAAENPVQRIARVEMREV